MTSVHKVYDFRTQSMCQVYVQIERVALLTNGLVRLMFRKENPDMGSKWIDEIPRVQPLRDTRICIGRNWIKFDPHHSLASI